MPVRQTSKVWLKPKLLKIPLEFWWLSSSTHLTKFLARIWTDAHIFINKLDKQELYTLLLDEVINYVLSWWMPVGSTCGFSVLRQTKHPTHISQQNWLQDEQGHSKAAWVLWSRSTIWACVRDSENLVLDLLEKGKRLALTWWEWWSW